MHGAMSALKPVCAVLAIACAATTSQGRIARDYKVVGYYTNWVEQREGCPFTAGDVDASLLTHINFAFAQADPGSGGRARPSWHLTPFGSNSDLGPLGQYAKVNGLKAKNPGLRTLLSVGGWTHNDSAMAWRFTTLAESPASRGQFIASAVQYVRENGFDGIDIDWEYPVDSTRGGRPQDRHNFTLLLRELRAAIRAEAQRTGKPPLLLTVAMPGFDPTQWYEPADVAQYVDWINLMAYDFAGAWSSATGMNAPAPTIRQVVDAYVAAGVPREKIVLGMPTYGHSFAGVDTRQPNAPHKGKGPKGKCTREPGSLASFEVADQLRTGSLRGAWDSASATPYAYDSAAKVWVTYDDTASLRLKAGIIEDMQLGGAMFWSLDTDDYRHGYPLISAVSRRLRRTHR